MEDKNILISENAWLNDNLMDAAQVLICKAFGVLVCSKLSKAS